MSEFKATQEDIDFVDQLPDEFTILPIDDGDKTPYAVELAKRLHAIIEEESYEADIGQPELFLPEDDPVLDHQDYFAKFLECLNGEDPATVKLMTGEEIGHQSSNIFADIARNELNFQLMLMWYRLLENNHFVRDEFKEYYLTLLLQDKDKRGSHDIDGIQVGIGDLVHSITMSSMQISGVPAMQVSIRAQFAELVWKALMQRLRICAVTLGLKGISLSKDDALFGHTVGMHFDPLG